MFLIYFYLITFSIVGVCFLYKLVRWCQYYFNTPKYDDVACLFTPAEVNFYRTLLHVVPDEYQIFGKVRIADVLQPQKKLQGRAWHEAFGKICAKHLDYVICRRDDLAIICAVELNDRSHQLPERQERDRFVRAIFQNSKIRLIEVEAKRNYDLKELKKVFKFLSYSRALKRQEQTVI